MDQFPRRCSCVIYVELLQEFLKVGALTEIVPGTLENGPGAATRAGRTLVAVCAAVLLSASSALASAGEVARYRLGNAGWSEDAIHALLSVHADEFELDASSGWLPHRLEHLARLGRHPSALRMIEAFPEFTDLFANAAEPGALARVIADLSLDRQETERLLNLFIGWPSRSEAAHLQRVLEAHGRTVMNFADTIHLYPVVEALVLAQAEQAPSAWRDWVAAELRRSAGTGQVEETLVVIETHGRAIARRMETHPGFANEFPYLWTSFRELVERQSSEQERHKVLTGLLSHEGLWETLAEPFGTAALARIEADWMPELLLALWGTEGWTQPVEATGRLFEHRGPMPVERRAWLLAELAADNQLRRLSGEWGLALHDADAFWTIALDLARADLLACALEQAQLASKWDGRSEITDAFLAELDRLAALRERALRRLCRDDDPVMLRALPGYYAATVIRDLWAGVPIGTMDVVSTLGEAYLPARYAGLLWRGAGRVRPEALRLGPRMSLDHLLTQRAALASGQAHAVNPRPQAAWPRTFVLVKDGWLAPVPRDVMLSLGAREGLFLAKETLQNLAIEGVGSSGFPQRVILHFRCAGLLRENDPQCQS